MITLRFICPLVNGIHARPAGAIEQHTALFQSTITLINHSKGKQADAKSVLSMIGADITLNDDCELIFSGVDEDQALVALKPFIEHQLADCDGPQIAVPLAASAKQSEYALAISLARCQPEYVRGTILSRGLGRGLPWVIAHHDLHALAHKEPAHSASESAERLRKAITAVERQLQDEIDHAQGQSRDVLAAHHKMFTDTQFSQALLALAATHSPLRAVVHIGDSHKTILQQSSSAYLQQRALDIDDLSLRLARQLGVMLPSAVPDGDRPYVVIATQLTPGQLLALPRATLKGVVLGNVGETSHTVILARAFGIPTLSGIGEAAQFVAGCDEVIVDANTGILLRAPQADVNEFYHLEQQKIDRQRQRLAPFQQGKGCSVDGRPLELAANITSAAEASAAFAVGAEAIGLFRTEMLFIDRSEAPDEEQQYQQYRQVITAAAGRKVIIRTLDIGGDKPLDYLKLPVEDNPFLGYRAVRIYPQFITLFHQQIRALLRASQHGPLDIMVPMISTQEEVEWLHQECHQVAQRLADRGEPAGNWRLGIMVEVPSTLYLLDRIAPMIDFISIGSNDLCQYALACDRNNPKLSHLYQPLQPTFLHLLRDIVTRAKAAGLATGLCGEMAAEPLALPLLLALGLDEISMAAPRIAETRQRLSQLSFSACHALLTKTLDARSTAEVRALTEDFLHQRAQPAVISPELILHALKAKDKSSVIKQLTDNLEVHQRVSRSADAETAIWQREAVFSTALGFAVAIPHCKAECVLYNSISVAHLSHPVRWNEDHDDEVSTVIMLTVSADDATGSHMKIFSRLARKLMHADFRQQLASSAGPQETAALLTEQVLSPQTA